MRKTIGLCALAITWIALPSEAKAADHWGLHNGETVDGNLAAGEAGWPDVSLQFSHGMSDSLDIGARLSFIYGVEGEPAATQFGMGLRAPIRIQVLSSDKVEGLFHVDPGIKFYTPRDFVFGIQLPIGFEAGFKITPEATISFGLDVSSYIAFSPEAAYYLSPTLGPGFEYHVDDHIGFGINTRFGFVHVFQHFSATEFAFLTQAAFLYRL